MRLASPPKLTAGQSIAILLPSFAAPGFAPAVHEQKVNPLTELTGADVVEFSTMRKLDAAAYRVDRHRITQDALATNGSASGRLLRHSCWAWASAIRPGNQRRALVATLLSGMRVRNGLCPTAGRCDWTIGQDRAPTVR